MPVPGFCRAAGELGTKPSALDLDLRLRKAIKGGNSDRGEAQNVGPGTFAGI